MRKSADSRGPVAQLIERVVRNDEVVGLIPIRSTSLRHGSGSAPVFDEDLSRRLPDLRVNEMKEVSADRDSSFPAQSFWVGEPGAISAAP